MGGDGAAEGTADDLPDNLRLQTLATLARRLEADHRELVEFLAGTLAGALPDAVRVHREGLFGGKRVRSVEVLLGQRQYELHVRHGRLEPVLAQVVGGVVLRHDPVSVDGWIEGLLGDLDQAARRSEATRAALSRLFL
jgi:hypothetical protein